MRTDAPRGPTPDPNRFRDVDPADAPAPTRGTGADDPIPMLTEIVQEPRYVPEDLPVALGDVEWAGLAERVRENVTERLARRSEALLDAQLRESLQAVIDRAAEALATELRASLSQTVRDVVARAVNEELTRLHAEIARRQP
jgi:hypothetical protein